MIANVISVIAAAIITIPMIKPFAKHLKIRYNIGVKKRKRVDFNERN